MNYAPSTPDAFGVVGFAAASPEAWNLAFLSHPYERGLPSDPNFGVYVRRTLQFNLQTCEIELAGCPEELTIVPWLRLPPPMFARLMGNLPAYLLYLMPLASALGRYHWLDTMRERSHLYREPHDPVHDAPVTSTAEARALLARFR